MNGSCHDLFDFNRCGLVRRKWAPAKGATNLCCAATQTVRLFSGDMTTMGAGTNEKKSNTCMCSFVGMIYLIVISINVSLFHGTVNFDFNQCMFIR